MERQAIIFSIYNILHCQLNFRRAVYMEKDMQF